MEDKMFELMEKMYSEFSTFKTDLTTEFKGLNIKVDKNALELESINSKIEIMAEIQQNIIGQTEKQIQEAIEPLCEDVSLIKGAIQSISNDHVDVSDKIEFIEMKEFNNERDLFMMKKKLAK